MSGRSNGSFNPNLKSLSELEPRVLNLESAYVFLFYPFCNLHIYIHTYNNFKVISNIYNMGLFKEVGLIIPPKNRIVKIKSLNGHVAIRET